MNKIRNTNFKDVKTKEYIKRTVPDIEISYIFTHEKEEKKEDENL